MFSCISSGRAETGPLPEESPSASPRFLPPYLERLGSGLGRTPDGINVTGQDRRRRRALVGEWLDFGDLFEMRPTEAMAVLLSEDLAWAGGGGFRGRLLKSELGERVVYTVELERGWVRAWIRPSSAEASMEVKANGEVFTSREGEFWVSSRTGRSELYLARGEVMTSRSGQRLQGKMFAVFPEGGAGYKTSAWDPEAVDVHIARVYPDFVRLAGEVDLDWRQGRTAATYASLRKKGWKRFHRRAPDIRK